MAMRRPRIKASANLMNCKRKPKAPVVVVGDGPEKAPTGRKEDNSKINEKINKNDDESSDNVPIVQSDINENTETKSNLDDDANHDEPVTTVVETPLVAETVEVTTTTILPTTNGHKADANEVSSATTTAKTPIVFNDTSAKSPIKVVSTLPLDALPIAAVVVSSSPRSTAPPTPPTTSSRETALINPNHSVFDNKTHVPIAVTPKTESTEAANSFKCPPNVAFNRSHSYSAQSTTSTCVGVTGAATVAAPSAVAVAGDDLFPTHLEDHVIQMDLQKSSNGFAMSPLSPSKTVSRQRIRATPIFGQRRNSFVGTSPSPHTGGDDFGGGDFTAPSPHRRERHYSASLSQTSNSSSTAATGPAHHYHHHTPHKYVPSMGRIRTESGCSAFSDSYAPSAKSRKTDEQQQRALSRRDFEARYNNGTVPDKSTLKMFDLIYYNPVTNPMEQRPAMGQHNIKPETQQQVDVKKEETKTAAANNAAESAAAAVPVPQLKLNSNGELILDDKSLVIETTAEQEARKVLANSSLIFLDENTGMNGFYKKQKRTKDWPPEETIKFYRCLQTVGTDFSLMGQLFPQRTRRDLKLKFKKEERCNLALINKALLYPKIFDIDELRLQLDAEEQARAEAERKWKEIKAQEAKQLKRSTIRKDSAAARALTIGDSIYQNENVKKKITRRKYVNKKEESTAAAPAASTAAITDESNNNNISHEVDDTTVDKTAATTKRKRRRAPVPQPATSGVSKTEQFCKILPKFECIKMEQNSQLVHVESLQQRQRLDSEQRQLQLEQEIADSYNYLLPLDDEIATAAAPADNFMPSPARAAAGIVENKSLVNLDDGSVTIINDEVVLTNELPPVHKFIYEEDNDVHEKTAVKEVIEVSNDYDVDDGNNFNNISDNVAHNMANSVTHNMANSVAHNMSNSVTHNMTNSVTHNMSNSVAHNMPNSVTHNMSNNVANNNFNDITNNVAPNVANNIEHDLAADDDDDDGDAANEAVGADDDDDDDCDMDEAAIQQILMELSEGSMVLVSTLDPNNVDKVLNEIYMLDKQTGELCDKPLNIPDAIVQCILTVMS